MMTMGKTLRPRRTTPNPPLPATDHSVPASTAITPTSAHVIVKQRWRSMPMAIATCWSSAMARSARPQRLPWKNHVTPAMAAPATTAVTSFSVERTRPPMTIGSAGMGSGMRRGMPARASEAVPRSNAPRPSVTMINEISGRPTSERSTRRLKAKPSKIIAADAAASAPATPSPNRWKPAPPRPAATIVHSPRAKLTIREAL